VLSSLSGYVADALAAWFLIQAAGAARVLPTHECGYVPTSFG
jgi:hypothetical protein